MTESEVKFSLCYELIYGDELKVIYKVENIHNSTKQDELLNICQQILFELNEKFKDFKTDIMKTQIRGEKLSIHHQSEELKDIKAEDLLRNFDSFKRYGGNYVYIIVKNYFFH